MSAFAVIARIFIVGTIFILIDYYSFQAVKVLLENTSGTTRKVVTHAWWSVTAFFVTTFIAGGIWSFETWNPHFRTYVQAFFVLALFTKLVISLFMFVDDGRRVALAISNFWRATPVDYTSRSRFLATAGVLMGGIPFLTLSYGMLRNMYRYTLHTADVKIKNLADGLDGLRIVQISDIHSGSFTAKEPLNHAIEMINAQNADIVVFTGDLVNNVATEIVEYIDVFSQIKAKHGVFSILGNHDYGDYVRWDSEEAKLKNLADLADNHKKMGWDLLRNENRILKINDAELALIGVENFSAKLQFPKLGRLADSYKGTENVATKILLSHDPSHWDYEVNTKFSDIDLTLSGHTHGFQFGIEIPGYIKWSPSQYAYKQWGGLYRAGEQMLYVNRGFGCLGYPGRVGILPEITLLTLRKA